MRGVEIEKRGGRKGRCMFELGHSSWVLLDSASCKKTKIQEPDDRVKVAGSVKQCLPTSLCSQ